MAKNTGKRKARLRAPESILVCPAGHRFLVIRSESAAKLDSCRCPVCLMEMQGPLLQGLIQPKLICRLSPPKKPLEREWNVSFLLRRAANL